MSEMAKNNLLKTDPYEAYKQRYDAEKKIGCETTNGIKSFADTL